MRVIMRSSLASLLTIPHPTCMSKGPNLVKRSLSKSQPDGMNLTKEYASIVDIAVKLAVDRQTGTVIGPIT